LWFSSTSGGTSPYIAEAEEEVQSVLSHGHTGWVVGVGVYRAVNGSHSIMLSPYSLPYFLPDSERIMTGCGFGCGLYRTTDSDQKQSKFGAETDKIYRIDENIFSPLQMYEHKVTQKNNIE
jgi:hypothetical protein